MHVRCVRFLAPQATAACLQVPKMGPKGSKFVTLKRAQAQRIRAGRWMLLLLTPSLQVGKDAAAHLLE
jgi:hypothetical protein